MTPSQIKLLADLRSGAVRLVPGWEGRLLNYAGTGEPGPWLPISGPAAMLGAGHHQIRECQADISPDLSASLAEVEKALERWAEGEFHTDAAESDAKAARSAEAVAMEGKSWAQFAKEQADRANAAEARLASLEAARSAEAVAETRAKLIEILDAEDIEVTDHQADLIVAYFAYPASEASDV